jgi:hypothetical protein
VKFNAKVFLQSLFNGQIDEHLPVECIEEYEERAGILEFDGGLTREEAEAQALQEILVRKKVKK